MRRIFLGGVVALIAAAALWTRAPAPTVDRELLRDAPNDGLRQGRMGSRDPSAASALTKSRATEHFEFRFAEDEEALRDVFANLEQGYARITKAFGLTLPEKVKVEIYPDLKLYHIRTFGEQTPDWAVGNFDPVDRVLRMVSPNNPGPVHSRRSVLGIATHEFAHCVILAHRGWSRKGLPNWLDEGTAEYYSDDFSQSDRKAVQDAVKADRIPSLADLEKDFAKRSGYAFSYTIADFIVSTFGEDRLPAFLKDPSAYEGAFSMSRDEFEAAWQGHLRKKFKPLDLGGVGALLERQKAASF